MKNSRQCTILIVDDNSDIIASWGALLRPLARVITAQSLYEALEKVRQDPPPDILIMDWWLENESAEVLLASWIEHNDGPVCVVTGVLTQEQRYGLYTCGVYNTFQKPVGADTLVSIVRRYISFVEQQRTLQKVLKEVKTLKRSVVTLGLFLMTYIIGPEVADAIGPILLSLF